MGQTHKNNALTNLGVEGGGGRGGTDCWPSKVGEIILIFFINPSIDGKLSLPVAHFESKLVLGFNNSLIFKSTEPLVWRISGFTATICRFLVKTF